ncbi:MAG: hypothetical protein FRX48_00767 [Lasallia pustulata]|uniref:C2 domain-containing protein n=1 Tax=Lasallia pustulata TaxID=136370 RepID=A0A5M8Q1S2_9LECA|nr:MAG: hypothetical protein FRX48_00767 [Lasallia pustulata]
MDNEKDSEPQMRNPHRTDAFATKFVDKSGKMHEKAQQYRGKTQQNDEDKKNKQPAGGFDRTPIPHAPTGYTVKFTIHRATNLPMADINSLSSDPYVMAQLNTGLPTRHKQDPPMQWRTPTVRRNTNPVWDCEWIVANVPASGFELKARIYDEDPADHDDRLGNVHVYAENIGENWEGIREQVYQIKKRMGSKRAYLVRGCVAMFNRSVHMSGNLVISAVVLGRTESENGGRVWTVGPCAWSRHLSPMIGRLAGTKELGSGKEGATEKYNFQANQIQLAGPVPAQLYHRYVEFRPFVAGMFTSHSLRGRILNHALHHQHARVYNYDRSTVYGSFPSPCKEMTLQFLDLVHFDQGGRIYTYVLTLDGQWRFTETGKEFGIDLLSKHTMHSDVNIYIAFSGEFFIRRLKNPQQDPEEQETHPPAEIGGGPPREAPPKDPACYELIIDNDSGTYRPNAELLPQLKEFMHRNLPGLKILTLDCNGDKKKMDKLKSQQRERKKAKGRHSAVVQGDGGSISSSDEEDLDAQAGAPKERGTLGKVGHAIAEPKDQIMNWVQGDEEREQRETEDDMAAASRGQGSGSGTHQ